MRKRRGLKSYQSGIQLQICYSAIPGSMSKLLLSQRLQSHLSSLNLTLLSLHLFLLSPPSPSGRDKRRISSCVCWGNYKKINLRPLSQCLINEDIHHCSKLLILICRQIGFPGTPDVSTPVCFLDRLVFVFLHNPVLMRNDHQRKCTIWKLVAQTLKLF